MTAAAAAVSFSEQQSSGVCVTPCWSYTHKHTHTPTQLHPYTHIVHAYSTYTCILTVLHTNKSTRLHEYMYILAYINTKIHVYYTHINTTYRVNVVEAHIKFNLLKRVVNIKELKLGISNTLAEINQKLSHASLLLVS